jgi:hypothetical protein
MNDTIVGALLAIGALIVLVLIAHAILEAGWRKRNRRDWDILMHDTQWWEPGRDVKAFVSPQDKAYRRWLEGQQIGNVITLDPRPVGPLYTAQLGGCYDEGWDADEQETA